MQGLNMKPQRLRQLSVIRTWIVWLLCSSVCSGMSEPTLRLKRGVFVAFSGEDLSINVTLTSPVNQTEDVLLCVDPSGNELHRFDIPKVGSVPLIANRTIPLKNLSSSGTYHCSFKGARVTWFVRVRAKGYREPMMRDYTEFITMAVFTGVLLLFSIFGSIYVCRGHWKETLPESGDSDRNRKHTTNTEPEEDPMDMTTAQSTSFYASLEPRPRSIYEVLDRSAVRTESNKKKPKSLKKTSEESAAHQDGGIECVYENFQD
uniref:Chromosome undetermined SCAF13751, whole genome shotgun sequence, Uncharacterized protein n=1 Tax=Nothobranchius kadleci TaxID=1051664 RepID=A0A1A8C719_NOTKA